MDIIAAEGADLRAEEAHFPTPDSLRKQPIRDWDQIDAFQRCVASLDAWPLAEPITGWDLRLITTQCRYDAQTAYLNRLAKF